MEEFTKKLFFIFLVAGTFFTSARATNDNRYSRETKAKQVEMLKGAVIVATVAVVVAVVAAGVVAGAAGVVGVELEEIAAGAVAGGELEEIVTAARIGVLIGALIGAGVVLCATSFKVVKKEALLGAETVIIAIIIVEGGVEAMLKNTRVGLIVGLVAVVVAVVVAVAAVATVKPTIVEEVEKGAGAGALIVIGGIKLANLLSTEKIPLPIGDMYTRGVIGMIIGGLLGVKGTKKEQGIVLDALLWMMVAATKKTGHFEAKTILLCGILGGLEGAIIGKIICPIKKTTTDFDA